MTGSMQLIREFCDGFIVGEKARRTRIVCSPDPLIFFFYIDFLNSYCSCSSMIS